MKSWIGCSGWQYDDWQGKFYPKDCPHSRWLDYYATQFNTVEINYSFYRFPPEKTVKKWYQQAPKRFRYSLKVPRAITHYKKFHDTQKMLSNFYHLCDLLEEKLGCVLFQLPPNLHYNEALLTTIINQMDTSKHNAIEFRHASWWQESVYKILKQAKVTFCSVNAPGLPHDIIKTTPALYLRMHGKKRWFQGHYSTQDLKKLAKHMHTLKFSKVWVYFNNDVNACAPKDAQHLQHILSEFN